MPGITGIITKMPRFAAEPELVRMIDTLRHEPFYVTGTWIDESLGVYVGWAARTGSFATEMPLRNERGDVTLAFSGEDFAEPGTRQHLNERGHTAGTSGPSYLVHLYEEDPSFPACLNGLFHGLVADRARGQVCLFNDRYGMHPICYHETKDAFYFAAEAKAILAVRPELRQLDSKSFGEFLSMSCTLENRTIFKDVSVLPGGSAWVFKNGRLENRAAYFAPREWEEQEPLDEESYYRELRRVFSQNLGRYMNGNEHVGVALTGGLDTRAIMAWSKAAPGSLPCYTFGGTYRESRDVAIARRVAHHCEQPYHVISVGREFLSKFAQYAERSVYLTEGSVDLLRASDLYVSERAREIAPAKVVGTYGSEILRSAVMLGPEELAPGVINRDSLSLVRQAEGTYANLLREHPVTFAAFRQSPWYHHGILALEQTQLTVRSPFLDNGIVRTAFRGPRNTSSNSDVRLRLIRDGNEELAQIASDRGIGGSPRRIKSALSHGFQEFTFKAEYAYDHGMPQWLARMDHSLAALRLERLFLGRHKLLHFRVWYRDALSGYIREILLDRRSLSRPYINREKLESAVEGHVKGVRNYSGTIHKLLALELLHRLFLDPK